MLVRTPKFSKEKKKGTVYILLYNKIPHDVKNLPFMRYKTLVKEKLYTIGHYHYTAAAYFDD